MLTACACYLMRFACLHARDPLLYSMTMDCVPASQRSRWAALNSLRTLSFSASAVLGGYLADHFGYTFSFDITAASLVACTLLFLPALLCFPRSEGAGLEGEESLTAASLDGSPASAPVGSEHPKLPLPAASLPPAVQEPGGRQASV